MNQSPIQNQFELIAYRGGGLEYPENTKEAFEYSLELSPNIVIDLDLQLTKDEILVVIHDDTLDRTTNGTGKISDYSLSELKNLDAGYNFVDKSGVNSFRGKGVSIPTLEVVLATCSSARFILDIRQEDKKHTDILIKTVEAAKAVERVIIVSELDEVIDRCREVRPEWTYGATAGDCRTVIFGNTEPHFPVYMVPEFSNGVRVVSAPMLDKLHSFGKQVWVWTIDEPADFIRLKKMGVDGIFTNLPKVMMNLK